MSYEILKTKKIDGVTFNLIKTARVSYYTPKGRARIKMEVHYAVEREDGQDDLRQVFWIKSRSEALKHYRQLEDKAVVVETTGVNALKRIFG